MQRGIFESDDELFRDARVQTIYGGTNEIMKTSSAAPSGSDFKGVNQIE